MRPSFAGLTGFVRRFAREEGGGVTVEAVLWIPFFMLVLTLITDASLAFFSRAQAFRIIENGNRAFSIKVDSVPADTAAWVEGQFLSRYKRANGATVETTTTPQKESGTVSTSLSYPARDVVLFNTLGVLSGWKITVQAQQYVEWPMK